MQRVCVYTLTYNEFDTIPYFYWYYMSSSERIVAYDNESCDGTEILLRTYPKVHYRKFETKDTLNDLVMNNLYNQMWKEAKDLGFDWVVVCASDEYLYPGKGLSRTFFQWLEDNEYDAVEGIGCQMFSEDAIPDSKSNPNHLFQMFNSGFHCPWYNKILAFNCQRIQDINYSFGCHHANPVRYDGQPPKIYRSPDTLVLHYKFIGGKRRQEHRRILRAARLSEDNRKNGLGMHLETPSEFYKDYDEAKEKAHILYEPDPPFTDPHLWHLKRLHPTERKNFEHVLQYERNDG